MTNLNRRALFATTGAALTLAAAKADAAGAAEAVTDLRGHVGLFPRLPLLDIESRGDFMLGMSIMNNGDMQRAANARAQEILKSHGVKPDEKMQLEKAIALLSPDPVLAAYAKSRSTHQGIKYRMLQTELHKRADQYLAALEAADKAGPGMVEFTGLNAPEYTRREIHTQPGGYVGDPFAGYMYRYGTDWGVLTGRNYQDESHKALAGNVPVPTDGKVKRVLDLGTSIGQLATSMKLRFPDAEVWGIDAGAPMVRYAHLKAADMGIAVNFSDRLAEDTKFPDNHFDIVTANILFHEVTAEAAKKIVAEVGRVLRPGGVFYPTDFYTNALPPSTAWQHFQAFWNHRWNNEDWMLEYATVDLNAEMRKSGMTISAGNETTFALRPPGKNVVGTKV